MHVAWRSARTSPIDLRATSAGRLSGKQHWTRIDYESELEEPSPFHALSVNNIRIYNVVVETSFSSYSRQLYPGRMHSQIFSLFQFFLSTMPFLRLVTLDRYVSAFVELDILYTQISSLSMHYPFGSDATHYFTITKMPYSILKRFGITATDGTTKYIISIREPAMRTISSWVSTNTCKCTS